MAPKIAAENAASVHAPTDIGLCHFSTRSMLRKRSGRPRSEINRTGDTAAPTAAIQRASATTPGSAPVAAPTPAITAAAPAAPPTKK